jgi:hypothetical protein
MHPLTWIAAGGAVACGLLLALRHRRRGDAVVEPDRIEALDPARLAELLRGTSMHLRDLRYRHSITPDRSGRADRAAFSADINSVRMGFVPVLILENAGEREGPGYVGFVFDGRRWCGPGLPCAGGADQAMAHALRCVSPLDPGTGS